MGQQRLHENYREESFKNHIMKLIAEHRRTRIQLPASGPVGA
jgi:hypothetical protein